jgi:hypothetical protein
MNDLILQFEYPKDKDRLCFSCRNGGLSIEATEYDYHDTQRIDLMVSHEQAQKIRDYLLLFYPPTPAEKQP